MNNHPLNKIFSVFQELRLTDTERTIMRTNIVHHVRTSKTASPYTLVRRLGVLALSMIIIVTSGGVLASASQLSLPGNFLYPIKRSAESVKKIAIRNSNDKVNYELSLLEKRFDEANTLINGQKMTKESEQILTQAIAQHTDEVKKDVGTIAQNNPAEALVYTTKLSSALKTNSSILLAISDKQPAQQLAVTSHTPTKLVLAAYQTAETVTNDTKKLETIVLTDTDVATIKTAEKKYIEAHDLLVKQGIITEPEPTTADSTTAKKETVLDESKMVSAKKIDSIITTTATDPKSVPSNDVTTANTLITNPSEINSHEPKVINPLNETQLLEKTNTITDLAKTLESAYQEKSYGKVIIVADKITQYFTDTEKIKASEKQYNIKVSNSLITPETMNDHSKSTETTETIDATTHTTKNNTH
jgi:hypothetical protein